MMNMSNAIGAAGVEAYHMQEFANARENYFSANGTVHTEWAGRLARAWELRGAVTAEHFRRLANGCSGTARRLTGEPVTRTTAVFDVAEGGWLRGIRFVPPIPDELRHCIISRGAQFQFSPQRVPHVVRVPLVLDQ